MVRVTETRMKCNDCGNRYTAVKKEGGFWNKLSYSPGRCPECGSRYVVESVGLINSVGRLLSDLLGG
jgi:transposase-like protein